MKNKIVTVLILIQVVVVFAPQFMYSQNSLHEKEFNDALRDYVASKIASHGDYMVEQEKFLLSLISLLNDDLRDRVGSVIEAKKQYLEALAQDKKQLSALETRLHASGVHDLDVFLAELHKKIDRAIASQKIDYKKKRIFEDAIQLLQVSEEMIQAEGTTVGKTNTAAQYNLTRRRLEQTFNKIGMKTNTKPIQGKVTVYDLYREWLMYHLTNYETKYMKVRYYRKKLLKKSNLSQIQKMASKEIEFAYRAFNYADYDLALSLLEDAYETYKDFLNDFSDVLFYAGESALGALEYPKARKFFNLTVEKYPGTQYYNLSLLRLTHLAIMFNEFDVAVSRFNEYMDVATPTDPNREQMMLTMALMYFNQERFNDAVALLSEITPSMESYSLARYLLGKCYASSGNFEQAKQVLSRLVMSKSISPDLFDRSLLRYALILYEEGDYLKAITLLQKIDEDFSQFDLVLDALAWCEYKYQQTLPPDQQNYSAALDYINLLLTKYYGSVYELELKTLKGYIYQISNRPTEAKDQYAEVYLAKKYKSLNDNYLNEREALKNLIEKSREYENKALVKNRPELFQRAKDTRHELEDEYQYYRVAETSSTGTRLYSELAKVLKQLKEIDRLRAIAQEKNDEILVKRLNNLELRLKASMERISLPKNLQEKPYNFFELNPTAKAVSEAQYRNKKIIQSRQRIQKEIDELDEQIKNIDTSIERATLTKDTKSMPGLIRKKAMFQELRKKYEKLLSKAYLVKLIPVYDELNQWADYGGFGMINVNFEMRQNAESALRYNADVVSNIEKVFQQKKKSIENQIRMIEAEIKIMTMKAREAERNRVRAERERSFKEGYFDTRSSEFEPVLPEIQLEGQKSKEQLPEVAPSQEEGKTETQTEQQPEEK